jgi:hypothetical protein
MLDNYRQEYVEFNAALTREQYLYHSGQKEQLELSPIYERYSDLFTRDSIASLKQALKQTPAHFETERKAILRLLTFAVDKLLEASVKKITEAIHEHEAKSTIEWGGERLTFQDCSVAIATEADRAARLALYKSRTEIIEKANDLRAERLSKLHEIARSLQTELSKCRTLPSEQASETEHNYARLYEELLGLDYSALAREAERLLALTESVYVAQLDELLKRDLGIGIEEAERPDAIYLAHQTRYDDHFPSDSLLEVYRETMAGLGIKVELQSNIYLDFEPRPHKSPRPFCAPILIPEEVKLVMRPMGGQSDYTAFLHEAGHAQHYGWTAGSLRPEFKYTGDRGLSETYAFLFNYLPGDGNWLAQLLGFRDNRDFIHRLILAKLMAVRRYAAKLIYELDLHTVGDLSRAAALYCELQTSATRFKTGQSEFLFDLDDSFYSADYLRAWAFEVTLREHLKTRFGKRWWTNRHAGNFLKEIWETGYLYSADEMANQIGIGPISFDPLIEEFAQALL